MVTMHQLYIVLIIAGPIFFLGGFQAGRWWCVRSYERKKRSVA